MAKLYQSENVSGEDWSETQNLFKSLISTLPYESPFFLCLWIMKLHLWREELSVFCPKTI